MEINTIGTQPSNPVYSGAKKAEAVKEVAPKAENAVQQDKVVSEDKKVTDINKSEQQRLDTVIHAASTFKDVYAVSDTRFTIFKDSTGQFVTRFTSLKDGSVTYVPEPDISRFVESNKSRSASLVSIKA